MVHADTPWIKSHGLLPFFPEVVGKFPELVRTDIQSSTGKANVKDPVSFDDFKGDPSQPGQQFWVIPIESSCEITLNIIKLIYEYFHTNLDKFRQVYSHHCKNLLRPP